MFKMPHAGEYHSQAGLVGGGDDFVVADRATGLDHGGGTGFGGGGMHGKRTLEGTLLGGCILTARTLAAHLAH